MTVNVKDFKDWFKQTNGFLPQYKLKDLLKKENIFKGSHKLVGDNCTLYIQDGLPQDPDKDTPSLVVDIKDVTSTVYYLHGARHRLGGLPALVNTSKDQTFTMYSEYGRDHRENGPSAFSSSDNSYREAYHIRGQLHRKDGPAELFVVDGEVYECIYSVYGIRHREDGPAFIGYNDYDESISTEYYKYGNLHREDGPALSKQFMEDDTSLIEYYIDGELHREDGPAKILCGDGKLVEEAYIKGKKKSDLVTDLLKIKKDKDLKKTEVKVKTILKDNDE